MLDHLGDLLRTQVLKKEKELIEKQIEEAQQQSGRVFASRVQSGLVLSGCLSFFSCSLRNQPSLLVTRDVSPGETSASQLKFHTDDVKSVKSNKFPF